MKKIYESESGSLWELTHVIIHPHGGGFDHKVPISDFLKEFKEFNGRPDELRLTKVSLEDYVAPLPAYVTRERWNGWAIPYFTFDNALEVAKAFQDMSYDPERRIREHDRWC